MPLPGMQNRTHGYHQGIATDTLPGRIYFERIVVKSINIHPVFASSVTGKGMPANEQKVPKLAKLITILYFQTNSISTKTCNTSKNTSNLFLQKILKTFIKYIAPDPAGVVQHRVIAWSCRPLRLLFIGRSIFSNLSLCTLILTTLGLLFLRLSI